jgi:CSLREA domain-containing protein
MNTLRLRFSLLLALLALYAASGVAATQTGSNFIVNSIGDTNDGQCDAPGQGTGNQDCTLREAINAANAYGDRAVVSFNFSGIITLTSVLPNITSGYVIDGSGHAVTVSGNGSVSIFQIAESLRSGGSLRAPVTLNALTIANGTTSDGKGAVWVVGSNAIITNCLFISNYNPGTGGALSVDVGSNVTVANCTFFNNTAGNTGGAVSVLGFPPNRFDSALYVYNSTFYNNHAHTVQGASGAQADIAAVDATVELRNTLLVTLDNNTNASGLTYVDKSVIYNSDIASQNANAVKATAAQVNLDSLPQHNGGLTRTVALLPGSVAINAGNNNVATGVAVKNQDQRGYVRLRPGDATCDIGAYESGAAGSLVVTTGTDASFSSAVNTLRMAVAYAQQLGGAQTVTFAPAMAGQTVTLSDAWDNANGYNSSSAIRVDGNITIEGLTSAPGITLQVADTAQLRHFVISSGGTLNLQNLTLTGGKPTLSGFDFGGAVWNFGALAVRKCTFTGNTAGGEGGAIHSWGGSPLLEVENSTFSGNSANGAGSAIGTGAVQNSLRYGTITGNTSTNGVLWIYETAVTMVNTIVAGNSSDAVLTTGGNGSGAFSAQSTNNILGASSASGLANGTNGNRLGVPVSQVRLGSLANNGGPTPTIPLQAGSVAVDAGVAIVGLTTDQIGTTRPQGMPRTSAPLS